MGEIHLKKRMRYFVVLLLALALFASLVIMIIYFKTKYILIKYENFSNIQGRRLW